MIDLSSSILYTVCAGSLTARNLPGKDSTSILLRNIAQSIACGCALTSMTPFLLKKLSFKPLLVVAPLPFLVKGCVLLAHYQAETYIHCTANVEKKLAHYLDIASLVSCAAILAFMIPQAKSDKLNFAFGVAAIALNMIHYFSVSPEKQHNFL